MSRIAFDDLRLNRAVLEVRYPKGYRYWDVCGKCILDINTKTEGKIDFLELRPEECILSIAEMPNAQASFGIRHMTLSGNKLRNIQLFKDNAPVLLDVVRTHLELQDISRVGFRLLYVFEMESYEQSEKFVESLELCSVDVGRFKGFGDRVTVGQSAVIASDEETKARISVSAGKIKDEGSQGIEVDEYAPLYAVLVDVDFSRENIKIVGFDIEKFMHSAHKKIKEHVGHLINK